MAKTTAKPKLAVGQRVWLEIYGGWGSVKEERAVNEFEVVETNKTSAYVVNVTRLDKYNENPDANKYMCMRVIQRTHEIKNSIGYSYHLWLTKENFERNVQYNNDLKVACQRAHVAVDKMTLMQLRAAFGESITK